MQMDKTFYCSYSAKSSIGKAQISMSILSFVIYPKKKKTSWASNYLFGFVNYLEKNVIVNCYNVKTVKNANFKYHKMFRKQLKSSKSRTASEKGIIVAYLRNKEF